MRFCRWPWGPERFETASAQVASEAEKYFLDKLETLQDCRDILADDSEEAAKAKTLLAYKARPLNGVWATAPYLHNGSVPNMRSLLARPDHRPTTFFVGSRRYDATNVGFATDRIDGETASEFRVHFERDDGSLAVIPGNDNAGHDYGGGICEAGDASFEQESQDCKSLLQYLKSL